MYTFYHISLISSYDEKCIANQNTYFVYGNFFFFESRTACVIKWKNIIEQGRPQMTKWLMPSENWVPEATNTQPCIVIQVTTLSTRV